MPLYGATVCIKFDVKDERLDNMMNMEHEDYKKIPEELIFLRNTIQTSYQSIVPIDFRYFYAFEQFEMITVLSHYEDTIELVLDLDRQLKELNYKTMITVGFGTVNVPEKMKGMKPIDVLNQMVGHGIYSAFEYYKMKDKPKIPLPYYFYSYHYIYTRFNVPKEMLEENKESLKKELQKLQETDERTQRHTYYQK